MYMPDILSYTFCNAMQSLQSAQVANTSTSTPGAPEQTFQSLLEKHQSRQETPGSPAASQPQDDKAETPSAVQGKQDDPSVVTMDLAALGAALLAEGTPQLQTPEQAAAPTADALVSAVAPSPVQTTPSAAETPAASVTVQQLPVQPQQQPQELQPQQDSAAAAAPAQISAAPASAAPDSGSDLSENAADTASSDSKNPVEVTDAAQPREVPVFQMTEHMPVKVGEAVTVDTTAPAAEMENTLKDTIETALDDGNQHLEIKLSPAHLGTVTVEFDRSTDGTLHVLLHTETSQAAKILNDHADALGLLLRDSANTTVRVEVSQPQQNQQPWQQPDQNGGQQQQQQQQQHRTQQQEAESFLQQLRLGLMQLEPEAV